MLAKFSISFFVFILISFDHSLFAQNMVLPPQTVSKYLCKKWTPSFAIENGKRMEHSNSDPVFYFEFTKDHIFILSGMDQNKALRGVWQYDINGKTIKVTYTNNNGGKSNINIFSLKEDEMIIISSVHGPDGTHEVKNVFIPSIR